MTKQQASIIIELANNDMNIKKTAEATSYSRNNITYHIGKIKENTGKNARCFYDLCELVDEAKRVLGL